MLWPFDICTVIWYTLWPFGVFDGHFDAFSRFDMLYQEKSGNPGPDLALPFMACFRGDLRLFNVDFLLDFILYSAHSISLYLTAYVIVFLQLK
jgi:hypothetical protein